MLHFVLLIVMRLIYFTVCYHPSIVGSHTFVFVFKWVKCFFSWQLKLKTLMLHLSKMLILLRFDKGEIRLWYFSFFQDIKKYSVTSTGCIYPHKGTETWKIPGIKHPGRNGKAQYKFEDNNTSCRLIKNKNVSKGEGTGQGLKIYLRQERIKRPTAYKYLGITVPAGLMSY